MDGNPWALRTKQDTQRCTLQPSIQGYSLFESQVHANDNSKPRPF